MKAVRAGYQRIVESSPTKKIERIARLCYKSEDKIGEGTDMMMLKSLLARGHLAMLEHGNVCLEVSESMYDFMDCVVHAIENNMSEINGVDCVAKKVYLHRTATSLNGDYMRYIISGNMRAWYEFFIEAAAMGALVTEMFVIVNEQCGGLFNESILADMEIGADGETWEEWNFDDTNVMWVKFVENVAELTHTERMVHENVSILFTTDRGVTHELVRMRDCSFAQESTRYCNYANDRFGSEITVIIPWFFADGDTDKDAENYLKWESAMKDAEARYIELIKNGATPQQARSVLPHSVKAEIVVTTNLREWHHILSLRACDFTGASHPQMHEIMKPLLKELRDGDYKFAFGNLMTPEELADL